MPFDDVLRRVRAGDPVACQELVERYRDLLLTTIRGRLSRRLRTVVEPDDVLQSAWREVLVDDILARDFGTDEQLLAYFAGVVRHKISQYHRKHLDAEKRDRRREIDMPTDVPQSAPGPEQLVSSDDEWACILSRASPRHRHGLELLRDGHSHADVAATLGISERHLRRVLEAVRCERETRPA